MSACSFWFIILPGYTKVKPFELTCNLKQRTEKLKTENKRRRNMKKQNSERVRPRFSKRISRKCRLISICIEQNNDHTWVMHKIKFCSSFKT